jgi:hypothetical protein
MGTNYYLLDGKHIGKVSSACQYCYDCGIPLVIGGAAYIHSDKAIHYKTCQKCGKEGQHACSFTWAIHPPLFVKMLPNIRHVKDEYGNKITKNEFLSMLILTCPVQFRRFMGVQFS